MAGGRAGLSVAVEPAVSVVPVPAPVHRTRARIAQRALEIVPGLVSWLLILSPLLLSFRFPAIVALFVLTFDFYWLYKAVVLTGSVCVTFNRMRRTMADDWRTRALALADPAARLAEIDRLTLLIAERVDRLGRSGQRLAAIGGRRELERLDRERRDLARLIARRAEPLPDPGRLVHVALVPTYTEPYEKLYETVRALAETDYPRDRLMVAIITRETDHEGRRNVARLRETFGDQFLHFFHILDPLEPGIVVGKSSAMAFGGRWLYREIVRLGFDPADVVVTDLDSDYRVHRQYFGYLTYTFLTDPDRYRRLYQPVPMFHNNLWATPLAVRLVAVGATHVQMWRSLTPDKLVSFSSYAVSLRTVHEVDYWATDAIPKDSRFYWKSFFRFSGDFRPSRCSSRCTATRSGRSRIRARSSSSTPRSGVGPGASPTSRTTSRTRSPIARSRAVCGSAGSSTCGSTTSTGPSRRSSSSSGRTCRCSSTRRSPRRRSVRTCRCMPPGC